MSGRARGGQFFGWLSALALMSALGLLGCGRDEPAPLPPPVEEAAPQQEAAPQEERAEAPALGRIVGRVILVEGATLPERTLKFGDADDASEGCPPISEADHRPVFEGDEGLVNILVSLTGDRERFFGALPPRKPAEVDLFIRDCRLTPRLVAAVVGDDLLLKNRSDRPMLPYVGRQGFVETLSAGETRREKLESRGVFPVGCGVTGFCGSADLVVLAHPAFGVTGPSGRFEIADVPADQDLTLHAWHPLFQEVQQNIRVPRGETVEVELTIRPLPGHQPEAQEEREVEREEEGENESPAMDAKKNP